MEIRYIKNVLIFFYKDIYFMDIQIIDLKVNEKELEFIFDIQNAI